MRHQPVLFVNKSTKHIKRHALFGFLFFLLMTIWALQASASAAIDKKEGFLADSAMLSSSVFAPVKKIMVEKGQNVKKGDVLVSLECAPINAEHRRVSSIEKSKRFDYLNKIKLKEYGAASGLEIDKARASLDEAKAAVDVVKAKQEGCIIKAPFDGMVRAVMINPYETAKEGQPMVEISRLGMAPKKSEKRDRSDVLQDIQQRTTAREQATSPEMEDVLKGVQAQPANAVPDIPTLQTMENAEPAYKSPMHKEGEHTPLGTKADDE